MLILPSSLGGYLMMREEDSVEPEQYDKVLVRLTRQKENKNEDEIGCIISVSVNADTRDRYCIGKPGHCNVNDNLQPNG